MNQNNSDDLWVKFLFSIVAIFIFIMFFTPWMTCISPYHVSKCNNICESKGMSVDNVSHWGGWTCSCKIECNNLPVNAPFCIQ